MLMMNFLVIVCGTALGTAAGWFLRAMVQPSTRLVVPTITAGQPRVSGKSTDSERQAEQMAAMMARLHQLTTSVAADVGAHNSRVQEINDELSSGGDVEAMVSMLMKANVHMQSQLQAAEQRMQEQAKEIETHVRAAHTDQLTGLLNRRAFDEELQRCVQALVSRGQPSCVMMVDVDHFKKFNDTYGHQAGDEVLRSVARVLRREASSRGLVCRYGGEEFAVVFPGVDIQAAMPLAEQARAAIAREVVEFEGLDLRVTASGGLAQLRPAETGESLVKRADVALYACKDNGRNCGYWHDGQTSLPMKPASRSLAAAGTTGSPQPGRTAANPANSGSAAPVSLDQTVFHFGAGSAPAADR